MLRREDVVAHVGLEARAPARAHSGLAGEVEHRVAVARERLQVTAGEVDGDEVEPVPLPCALDVAQLLRAGVVVVEAVHPDHVPAVAEQRLGEVGTDESGAAGDEGPHIEGATLVVGQAPGSAGCAAFRDQPLVAWPSVPTDARDLGARLRAGDRVAAPAALNLIEDRSPAARERTAELLAEVSPTALGGEAPAHLIGITGPPGAGKSTLLSALVGEWRAAGRTVAVLAVDPSSKRSGGSLLGDRARIDHDPRDNGVLIRSTAAGGRLGGLAAATREAVQALAAAFDVVVVETVGVGQSETDVEEVCDTVAVIVQPGSGDTLQFLKAGVMEVPDVLVVTKADLGDVAVRARRDLSQALASLGSRGVPVLAVSSVPPVSGIEDLIEALEAHRAELDLPAARLRARRLAALADLTAEHGEKVLRALGGRREAERLLSAQDPALDVPRLVDVLREQAGVT